MPHCAPPPHNSASPPEAGELLEASKAAQLEGREALGRLQAELTWARANRPELLRLPEVEARIEGMHEVRRGGG